MPAKKKKKRKDRGRIEEAGGRGHPNLQTIGGRKKKGMHLQVSLFLEAKRGRKGEGEPALHDKSRLLDVKKGKSSASAHLPFPERIKKRERRKGGYVIEACGRPFRGGKEKKKNQKERGPSVRETLFEKKGKEEEKERLGIKAGDAERKEGKGEKGGWPNASSPLIMLQHASRKERSWTKASNVPKQGKDKPFFGSAQTHTQERERGKKKSLAGSLMDRARQKKRNGEQASRILSDPVPQEKKKRKGNGAPDSPDITCNCPARGEEEKTVYRKPLLWTKA